MPVSTLTAKGQTTVPKKVRDALGLKPSDRIVYRIEDRRVVMEAAEQSVDELYGAFERPQMAPMDSRALRSEFEEDTARRVEEKMP